jgi:replicative DNA helicase
MLDAKILNWMMQASANISNVYSLVEFDLLRSIFFPKYKAPLSAIHSYYSRHKTAPSYGVLKSLLEKEDEETEILEHIEAQNTKFNEVGYFIDEIKERYNKYLIENLAERASDLEPVGEDIRDFNDSIKRVISKTERLYKNDVFSEGEVKDSVEDRINQYKYTAENPEAIMGFLSGYKELDDYTWGIKNSEMLVIGGASSSGKSLFMMNMAINAWLGSNVPSEGVASAGDGKNILFISLEMSKQQLEQRVDANVSKVRHRGLARGQLSSGEQETWGRCLSFQEGYDKKFYILDMPRGTSMGEIEAKYENILGIFKPDAVFIDYLQLMKPTVGQSGTDWLDVGKVSEELHEFCRKKNIPVVTAAQRKAAQRKSGGKRSDDLSLEDLGRSKMIGDNAAIVFLIANREDEQLREDIEIHIVKNRDGAKGKVSLKKVFDKSRIEPFPDDWAGEFGDENEV